MTINAFLTVMGLYNYTNGTIFDDFILPDALEPQRETITANILLECGELECLYPQPDIMRLAVGTWAHHSAHIWAKLAKEYDYDPRKQVTSKDTTTASGSNAGNDTTDGSSTTEGSSDSFTFAFNSPADSPVPQGHGASGSSSATHSTGSNESRYSSTTISEHEGSNGDIAASIRAKRYLDMWDIVEHITSDFRRRFCLLVY